MVFNLHATSTYLFTASMDTNSHIFLSRGQFTKRNLSYAKYLLSDLLQRSNLPLLDHVILLSHRRRINNTRKPEGGRLPCVQNIILVFKEYLIIFHIVFRG